MVVRVVYEQPYRPHKVFHRRAGNGSSKNVAEHNIITRQKFVQVGHVIMTTQVTGGTGVTWGWHTSNRARGE